VLDEFDDSKFDDSKFDYSKPLHCDVVIAGAGLAGLVAGAILSKHGRKVVVVDGAPRIGGRAGGTPHRGYWLDGGQRAGSDVGDLQVGWRYGQIAAQQADVEVPLRVVEPVVRVHQISTEPGGAPAQVLDGRWGAGGFIKMAKEIFGCPEEDLPEFIATLAAISGASEAERHAAIPMRLGPWLEANVKSSAVRRALLTMVTVIYCEYPADASLGRLMGFFDARDDLPKVQPAFPNHPRAGGIQGLMLPFAEAIEARSGRILLGLAPRMLTFEGTRCTGLVAVNEGQLACEIQARDTIVAMPVWQAIELLPRERVDPDFAQRAAALAEAQGDAICWQAGLHRLPTIRATGETESHEGWNRVLEGDDKRYLGGFHFPSLSSRASAPEGKHLIHAFVGRWLSENPDDSWAGIRKKVDRVVAHLHEYYADLEECIEWSAIQHLAAPAFLSWYWAPLRRHGLAIPGCESVYIASTTIESDAGPIDIAAHAGLEAARLVLGG
jgi:phytoene dehydrogenase-like protein